MTGVEPPTLEAMPDKARLMAHLAEFARRVKLSGTREELESFRYLQACLDEYGFRTQLLSHEAYISLPGRAAVTVDGRTLGCITHSMAPSGRVSGTLVPVGRGEAAAFSGRDLRGCVLLVDGIAAVEVARRATQAGAAGVLHVSPNEHLYEMCISPVWGSPSAETRAALPGAVTCSITHGDGAALRERCAAGETVTATLEAEVDTGWRQTPLLVGDMAAPDAAAPFVLLSGHHDTWHFGVMDNGAANATMLEAVRLLATRRDAWRRGLRVCFWSGHSHGRYSGSAWYADEHWDELDRDCAAHVNVDSTGGRGAEVLTRSGVSEELRQVAAEAVLAVSGQAHEGLRQGRAADQSFWGVGIPSMFGSLSHQPPGPLPVALGWWWHTPHDLLANIDPDNLVRDTTVILHVLVRLLCDPVLPFDPAAQAVSLVVELDAVAPGLEGRLDIAQLREAAFRLLAEARACIPRAGSDRALMALSRALLPLSYTEGDRFRHDPAVQQPPWPSLEPLRALARLDATLPELAFHRGPARQARNRVQHALRQAHATLQALPRHEDACP